MAKHQCEEYGIPFCTNKLGHVWGEWKQLDDIIIWKDNKWGYTKIEIAQTRVCSICGYTQVDKQEIT
jgi:hypothetical protein